MSISVNLYSGLIYLIDIHRTMKKKEVLNIIFLNSQGADLLTSVKVNMLSAGPVANVRLTECVCE